MIGLSLSADIHDPFQLLHVQNIKGFINQSYSAAFQKTNLRNLGR